MKKLIKIISLMFVMSGALAAPPDWQNPVGMQYSMTITAVVKVDGVELTSTNDMVAAFVGNEVRGAGNLIYHGGLDKYFIFLTVFSDNISGETLSFKAYHSGNDAITDMLNELTFVNDEQVGQISDPYVIANNSPPLNLALSNQTIAENELEDTEIGIISAEDPDNPPSLTYYLATGNGDTDNASFSVDGNTLNSNEIFDFETKQSYEIRLGVHDGTGGVLEKEFTISISDVNEAPTDISLDNNTVDENQDIGILVGELTTSDQDIDDAHSYSLVSGDGDDDNASFTLSDSQILTDFVGDYEVKNEYSIRIASEDSGNGIVEKSFTIILTDINDSPTSISLDNTDINENLNVGFLVGELSTNDQDTGDSHTYSFVSGEGDSDNSSFTISGSQLLTGFVGDYETKNEYTIRIASEDVEGKVTEKTFFISIIDINESPSDIILDNIDIEENQSSGVLVGNLSTSDQDEEDLHTYSFVSGEGDDDNESFIISDNQLFTGFIGDHEVKSEYAIRLATEDSGGEYVEVSFTITILDVNDFPLEINLDNTDINENENSDVLIGELSTSDQDEGDSHTYSFVSGNGDQDNQSFIISGSQLLTNFVGDYEVKNEYLVRISSEDIENATVEKSFTITISDVNDAPTQISLDNSSFEEGLPIGTLIGNLSTEDQDSGDAHNYTFVSGEGDDDNASFTISEGELLSAIVGDFDVQNEFSIRVKSTDLSDASVEIAFTILLTNADNNSPTDIELDNSLISENEPSGTLIGNLSTSDLDVDDTHTYQFVTGEGDGDNALFSIDGTQILTAFVGDYETKNEYTIRVSSEDSGNAVFEKPFIISITDINEAPTELLLDNISIAENQDSGTLVGEFSSSDQDDGDTHTYSLASGEGDDDNNSFTINGAEIYTDFIGDYETKNEYFIRVATEDSGNESLEQTFIITINDINDAPTGLTINNSSIAENQDAGTLIGELSTTDQDTDDSHNYSFVTGGGDDDNDSFIINGSQVLTDFVGDYETKNEYSIKVSSEDSGGEVIANTFTITLTDENDVPSEISIDNSSFEENLPIGELVAKLSTLDEDEGDSHIYSFVTGDGDDDNEFFTIEEDELLTNVVGDFDVKNEYIIRLKSVDEVGAELEKSFTILVINADNNDPTDIDLDNSTIAENEPSGSLIGNLSTTDEDEGDSHTYSLVSGNGDDDNNSFSLSNNQLFIDILGDYESQDNFSVRISSKDTGNGSVEKKFTITLTDINDVPTAVNLDNTQIEENKDSGFLVGELTTEDQDDGDAHNYAFVSGEGDVDNASFIIDGSQILTAFVGDFETKNEYLIRVSSEDSGNETVETTFTITITDVNDSPSDIVLDNSSLAENQESGTLVGEFTTIDQDSDDTHNYSFISGDGDNHNESFTLSGNQILTAFVGDFESQNEYTIRIKSEDLEGKSIEKTFTISITDENDKPTEITLDNNSFEEGLPVEALIGSFSTTDQDSGDSHTYSLVSGEGNSDNSSFTINENELLSNIVGDFDVQNEFTIRVKSEDQSGSSIETTFTILLTDSENASPTAILLDNNTVIENQEAGSIVGNLSTMDSDEGDVHTYNLASGEGDDDNDSFGISGNQLVFNVAGNYEVKSNYSVRLSSKDSGNEIIEEIFTISLIDVNEAPTFTKGEDQIIMEDAGSQTVNSWATNIENVDSGQVLTFNVSNDNNDLFSEQPQIDVITGDLSFVPADDVNGSVIVTVVLTDDGGNENGGDNTSEPETFLITIVAVNDIPLFTKGADQSILEDAGNQVILDWATNINPGPIDENSQNLTFTVTNDNNDLFSVQPSIDSSNGVLSYTPALNAFGSTLVTIILSDDGGTANGGEDTSSPQIFTITINPVNDAPFFTKGSDQHILEDVGSQGITGWATSISAGPENENDQALNFEVSNDNNELFSEQPQIDAITGDLSFVPANDANGSAIVTVVLIDDGGIENDGNDTSAPQTFTITINSVNDAPAFIKGADQEILEDGGGQVIIGWANGVSTGPLNEGDQNLTFTISNDNNNLFSNQPDIDVSSGDLTYTPAADAYGLAIVTVILSDDGGTENGGVDTSDPQTFIITINPVNDAPTFMIGNDLSILEDAGSQSFPVWATDMSSGPNNENTQGLNFNVSNDNVELFTVQPQIDEVSGDLIFETAPDAYGSAMLIVTLSDDGGTVNGGIDTSESQTFVISVFPVNDPPIFTKGESQTVNEDAGSQVISAWASGMSAGTSNENDQNLSFIVITDNNDLFSALPEIDEITGDLTFTPATDAFGVANITIHLSDDGGTVNGGADNSVQQSFTITVDPVNDAPVIDEILIDNFCPGGTMQIDLTNFTSDIDNAVSSDIVYSIDVTNAFDGFEATVDGVLLNLSHNALQAGSFDVVISANDQNGGFSFRTINITSFYLEAIITNEGNVLTVTEGEGYKWFLDGNVLESEITQSIIAHDVGDYTVEVTYSGGCVAVSDTFFVDNLTSVNKPVLIDEIRVYPNPVNDFIHVDIKNNVHHLLNIQIIDLKGQQVLSERFIGQRIDVSGLTSGVYILHLSDKNGILGRKKIIKK